ncbi:cutinase [Pyronema domesticum]|nr:cutinase [Pyronema domesticum]
MTRNELLEGKCAPIIVIFARGTTEPGNVGDDVGPMFFDALMKLRPGKVMIQGVNNYKADIWGYLGGGSEEGAQDMANSVDRAAKQCPQSKIVMSGFSQGAQVTHKAAYKLKPDLHKFVGAIVLFGDPFKGDAFPGTLNNNVKTFCHDGDLICIGLPIPTPAHSNYEDDAPEAAAYVAARM